MRRPEGSELIGKWVTDPEDAVSLRRYGRVILEFTVDGWLIYTVENEGKLQEIVLTYRVQEGVIISDQFHSIREEHTRFSISAMDKLTLTRGRCRSSYVRWG